MLRNGPVRGKVRDPLRKLLGTLNDRWGRVAWPAALLLSVGAFLARPAHPGSRIEPLAVSGGTPFQASGRVSWTDRNKEIQVQVPAGKVLIVQHVSLRANIGDNTTLVARVCGEFNGRAEHVLILQHQGELFSSKVVAGSAEMTLYASEILRFELTRSAQHGLASTDWSLTGLLVDQ